MKRVLIHLAFLALPLGALAQPSPGTHYQNPVIAGDYPDPSIIRVGDEYWAVATTSDWGPQFPLLRSKDMVNWTAGNPVFAHRPSWAVGKFWAPEIIQHNGRFFIYYTAEKRDGPLSVAVASADNVQGPYKDHGPIISQHDGSIDAFPITDVNGGRYLVWKEDSNSIQQPTPIFAQRLAADGYTLQGEAQELMRNTQEWEGPLIEGPFIKEHGDYFYMFYSGNACCGVGCKYAVGVARAKKILGPWEKYAGNPILAGNEKFRCPGHGSIVTDQEGRDFFFYHAVSNQDSIFVGRQAMLDRVTWGADGWPSINEGRGPSESAPLPYANAPQRRAELSYIEKFADRLGAVWSWPQGNEPVVSMTPQGLSLNPGAQAPANSPIAAVLGQSLVSGDYRAETTVRPGAGKAGISAYGNKDNAVGLSVGRGYATVWQITKGELSEPWREPFDGPEARLRLSVWGGDRYQFSIWKDGKWTPVGQEINRSDLPPWDLAVRAALTASAPGATFSDFSMSGEPH